MSRWNKFDLVGLLFPRRCPVCHEVVEDPGELACDICRTRLVRVRDPFCGKCGKPLAAEEQEYCGDCMRKKHAYDRGRAAFVYEEWMRRSIAQYKYGGRREYAEFYAEEILLACAREQGLECSGDSAEITWIDSGFTDDQEKYVTELQIPVVSRTSGGYTESIGKVF